MCESPGPQHAARNLTETRRCWDSTSQDARFERVRCENGFQDCYITNSVKCGVRRGSRHTDEEIGRCSVFLVRELELLTPMVVVGVGENAYWTLREQILPELRDPPVLFGVTHYSARGNLWPKWEREFGELQRMLKRLKPRNEW